MRAPAAPVWLHPRPGHGPRTMAPKTTSRLRHLAALAALPLVVAACGNDDDQSLAPVPDTTTIPVVTTEAAELPPADPVVVAEGIAFTDDTLTLPAGDEVEVTFQNRDDGTPHSLHIVAGDVDVATDRIVGDSLAVLTVRIDEPGSYEFFCDVHSEQMRGTVVVE